MILGNIMMIQNSSSKESVEYLISKKIISYESYRMMNNTAKIYII